MKLSQKQIKLLETVISFRETGHHFRNGDATAKSLERLGLILCVSKGNEYSKYIALVCRASPIDDLFGAAA